LELTKTKILLLKLLKKGRHPQGATMCASCEKEEQTSRLINEIASEWSEKVKVKSEIGEMKKKKIH
jgi:hypothetical protein